jgi:hypothetical protein
MIFRFMVWSFATTLRYFVEIQITDRQNVDIQIAGNKI